MRTVGSSQPITNLGERLRVSRADLICRLHSHQHVTRDPSIFTHSHVPHFLISMDVFRRNMSDVFLDSVAMPKNESHK